MKSRRTKPWIFEGDELGVVCHLGHPKGPLVVHVCGITLSAVGARSLAKWLVAAANEVTEDRRKRPKADGDEVSDES